MECAFTKGRSRERSTGSACRDPRKTSLQPVAEPTRMVHPASSIFEKRIRAALTTLVAASLRLKKSGEADGRTVRTTLLPDGPIFLLPAIERILVGPFTPF